MWHKGSAEKQQEAEAGGIQEIRGKVTGGQSFCQWQTKVQRRSPLNVCV